MNIHTFILSISCVFFTVHLHAENVTPVNDVYSEEGFKAVSYIITKKYLINKITGYCSEIVEKDIACAAEDKWIKSNEMFFIAARMKDDHYINYISEKHGSNAAELKKIESEKIYSQYSDEIISDYFANTDTHQDKIDKCNNFIEKLNSGAQDIIYEGAISEDLEKLLLFAEKVLYNKSVKQTD